MNKIIEIDSCLIGFSIFLRLCRMKIMNRLYSNKKYFIRYFFVKANLVMCIFSSSK